MLTSTRLHDLSRELESILALTVYGSSRYEDPATRREWRLALDLELQRIAQALEGAPHREREDFARAAGHLEDLLAGHRFPTAARGWLAVATAERIELAEPFAVDIPVEARWGRGMLVAPSVRVLGKRGAAIVAVVDGRSGRLYRYEDDIVRELESFTALAVSRPAYHMSAPPRRGFHRGTRGTTGRDAAERDRRAARARMIRQIVGRLTTIAVAGERLLLGGMSQMAIAIRDALPADLAARAAVIELDVHASEADLRRSAGRALAEVLRSDLAAWVDSLVATWTDAGRAAVGIPASLQRLAERSVARLVVTEHLLREHPEDAERAVWLALEQGADLDYATDAAAARLDRVGEGIGVALRFVAMAPPSPTVASAATPA
ncbi:MAG TPA: hypothetical protein VK922_03770 [Gemmatimonadaceae bacterium]|nr:hypothetical protein [Gemmatimonadaceae bacterium]